MTSQELIRGILFTLQKKKLIIFLGGLVVAGLLFIYASSIPIVYSVKSTLYPLTANSGDNASSKISDLIGGSGPTKTLSEEANVNIEEVAKSRKTREAVVRERLSQFGNKPIAVVLIEEYNKNRSQISPEMMIPTVETDLISLGANLFASNYSVKFNKNSLLEIVFTSTNKKLIKPGSLILIDKISEFYKELKIKKAQFDYDFTQKKVDSLERLLNKYDNQRIHLSNTTLFVQPGKIQYTVPKENLENNKLLVLSQRNGAASNREEALWRKQKVTPIVEILDAPEPPFIESSTSKPLYALVGFLLGCLLISLVSIASLFYRFMHYEFQKKLVDTVEISTVSSTV